MKKLLTPIVYLLFVACTKTVIPEPIKEYTFTIDSVLTKDGVRSLPLDANGYYHLRLIRNANQQPHRITGRILLNGKEPYPVEKIDWENNMFWWLRKGDTTATITKAYINYFTGQFTIVNLPPMIASKDELVPTINKVSYSGTKGEINTIISPISEMIGDTMIVKGKHSISNKTVFTKIILE